MAEGAGRYLELQKVGTLDTLLSEGTSEVDITARDVTADALAGLKDKVSSFESLGPATLFTVSESQVSEFLTALIAAGGRVHEVQPRRQSLESLFVHEAEVRRDG